MSATPCDVDQMLKSHCSDEPDFVIDGIHFGRGDSFVDRHRAITLQYSTVKLTVWHIKDDKLNEIDPSECHTLQDSETYITRWVYKEKTSQENGTVLFYWKGQNASKGFSPLPEDLEKDDPPVERIVQWAEPPIFLRLFQGKLKTLSNFGEECPRLFILRGEVPEEVHLFEVACTKTSLRSRGCFVLEANRNNVVFLWLGNKSTMHSRTLYENCVKKMFPLGGIVKEGNEGFSDEFWKCIPGDDGDESYDRCLNDEVLEQTPRLFYLNSITGDFLATEVENGLRGPYVQTMPFLQSHLYTAIQPAIFMLDDCDIIWLWKGWNLEDNPNFDNEWTAAKQTAINYSVAKKTSTNPNMSVAKIIETEAGSEVLKFTNLFPVWNIK